MATSAMEAEYSALSMAMRDLLALRELLLTLAPCIHVDTHRFDSIRTVVLEDNAGALQ
jgi:hypothetical protein